MYLKRLHASFRLVFASFSQFLKERKLPPEFVVGCEGSFGALMMVAIVLPTVYYLPGNDGGGVHENALDAGVLISNNALLAGLVVSYWISIAFYNFCGLAVAKSLSSVHRCLIDACRTVLVWGIELILAYAKLDIYILFSIAKYVH